MSTKISEKFRDPEEPEDFDAILAREAEPRLPVPGDRLHVLVSGFCIPTNAPGYGGAGHVLERGQTITLTADLIEAAKDRLGGPGWVALVHDPDEQLQRYGRVMIAPGPFPETARRWVYGSADWADARERARRDAWSQPTAAGQRAALEALESEFGPAAITSVMTGNPNANREADEHAERVRRDVSGGI